MCSIIHQFYIHVQDSEPPLRPGSTHVYGTLSSILSIYNDDNDRVLPPALHDRLRALGMGEFEVRSWVRSQTVGYLARLNDVTLTAIKASRLDASIHGGGSDVVGPPPAALPLPLPSGTVAAHVRHGDKGSEMDLVSEMSYFDAAKRLLAAAGGDSSTAKDLREKSSRFIFSAAVGITSRFWVEKLSSSYAPIQPILFASTEDTESLVRLVSAGESHGWTVFFSRILRFNEGPSSQMEKAGLNAVRLTRAHLGQLLLALEADAWVGTYASNWNRLIDELRGVWVPKIAGPYVEVGDPHDYQVW